MRDSGTQIPCSHAILIIATLASTASCQTPNAKAEDAGIDPSPDLIGIPGPQCDRLKFDKPFYLDTGFSAHDIASGDMNNDGHSDIVVWNHGSRAVSTLLNGGDGTAFNIESYPTNQIGALAGRALVVAEFTGDQWLDVAVGSNVGILPNLGNGILGAVNVVQQPYVGFSIVPCDLDGDAKTDLVLLDEPNLQSGALLNRGKMGFQVGPGFVLKFARPISGACADLGFLNQKMDGKNDIVAVHDDSKEIQYLYGTGNGTLQLGPDIAVGGVPGPDPSAITTADFNRDGIPEPAVAWYRAGASYVSVYLSTNNGKPYKAEFIDTEPAEDISAADFDRDGNMDVAIRGGYGILIALGRGDGTFEDTCKIPIGEAGFFLTVANYNGDGRPDLATSFQRLTDLSGGVAVVLSR